MKMLHRSWWLTAVLAGFFLLSGAASSHAQVERRYEPSRPTVSPYLNLFRFNNSIVPNYQSLVRPEIQAQRFKQQQQQYDRQQSQSINQLKSNVQVLQEPAVKSQLVAPTGKGSWFNVPGGSKFGDTSRYYSQSAGSGSQPTGRH